MEDLRQYIDKNGYCVLPEGITEIHKNAFMNCTNLRSITIPEGIISVGKWAFYNCYNLKSITIPQSVTNIGCRAFSECTCLESITLPTKTSIITEGMFSRCCLLKSITIPNSVTSIEDRPFYNCHSLESITIPESVTLLGIYTFEGFNGSIYFKTSNPLNIKIVNYDYERNDNIVRLLYLPPDSIIYVPEGSIDKYKNHPSFKHIENIKEFKTEATTDTLTACRQIGEKGIKNNDQTTTPTSKLNKSQTKPNSLKR